MPEHPIADPDAEKVKNAPDETPASSAGPKREQKQPGQELDTPKDSRTQA